MRALIFTVSIGSGHNKAAEAIADVLAGQGWSCEIVDTLQYINKAAHKIVVGTYLESVKFTPKLYGLLYRKAETGDGLADVSQVFNQLFSLKLPGLVEQYKPDIMVCTHPFPLQMLSILKGRRKFQQPFVAILTDYAVHPFWVHRFIDAYVLPADNLVEELNSQGVDNTKIYPLGIPIKPSFLAPVDKTAVYSEFKLLPNKPIILVMGGGLGFGHVEQTIEALVQDSWDIQVVAVAGNNKKLFNRLQELAASTEKILVPLSYTEKISSLMEIADVLVSKPGGLTVTEAMLKHLPFAILAPIPGQEEHNSEFLLNNGMAVRLRKTNPVPALKQLLQNPLRLNQIQAMTKQFAKPNSTTDIAEMINTLALRHQRGIYCETTKNDV